MQSIVQSKSPSPTAGFLTAGVYGVSLWIVQRPLLVTVLWVVDRRSGADGGAVTLIFTCVSLVAIFLLPRALDIWIAHGFAIYVLIASLYAILFFPASEEYDIANLLHEFQLSLIVSVAFLYALVGVRRLLGRITAGNLDSRCETIVNPVVDKVLRSMPMTELAKRSDISNSLRTGRRLGIGKALLAGVVVSFLGYGTLLASHSPEGPAALGRRRNSCCSRGP